MKTKEILKELKANSWRADNHEENEIVINPDRVIEILVENGTLK